MCFFTSTVDFLKAEEEEKYVMKNRLEAKLGA